MRSLSAWFVRASLAVLAVALIGLPRAVADLGVTIGTPPPLQGTYGSPFRVGVTVTSTLDVASVRARVGAATAMLAPAGLPSWTGQLDLTGEPYGAATLEVTVTDIAGATATATRNFTHDEPPVITISSPPPNHVARPTVDVVATCVDDNPGGCVGFSAAANAGGSLAGVNGSIDGTLDLQVLDGSATVLHVSATYLPNNPQRVQVPIFVEASPALVDVISLGHRMLDVDDSRYLYVGADGVVRVHRRSDGHETALGPVVERADAPALGHLTSTGAVYVSRLPAAPGCNGPQETFEWRGAGAPASLGVACEQAEGQTWTFAGDWGWRMTGTGQIVRRNVATGAEGVVMFPADVGGPYLARNRHVLAGNGDLLRVVLDGSEVRFVRDRGGVQMELGRGAFGAQTNPVFDGHVVAYLEPASPEDRVALARDGQAPLMLGDPLIPQLPGEAYAVGGGWVVFTRLSPTSGARQLWRRSPAGAEEQVTPFASDSVVDVVAPDGTLTVLTGGQTRYLAGTSAVPRMVGSELGRARFLSDALYVVLGPSVLRFGEGGGVPVDAGVDADTTIDAGLDGGSSATDGDGGCGCSGGGPRGSLASVLLVAFVVAGRLRHRRIAGPRLAR